MLRHYKEKQNELEKSVRHNEVDESAEGNTGWPFREP
jgi:hypothetical protein